MPERWRTGRSVGRTIYVGDTLADAMEAEQARYEQRLGVNLA